MSDEDVSSKLLTQVARLTLRVSNLRAEIERLETERDEWKSSHARIERLEAALRGAQEALGEGEWIAASDILFDALAGKER